MILLLHGPDSFRIHERLGVLRQGFQDKYDPAGHNVQSYLASEMKADDIRSSLLTAGLFLDKRFVVIHDAFDLSESASEVLLDTITKIDQDTIVVCIAEKLPKAKSELKTALLKADRVEEYGDLTDEQLRAWIKQRITAAGAAIENDALAYILHSIGNDLWTLHHTIEQLTAYTSTITMPVVQKFVQSSLDDDIFHFTDALSEQNAERALKLLHDQLAAGSNVFYLLTMLARQIRVLIEVKETGGKGSSLHPYVIKKAHKHAQRFSLDKLEGMHRQLVDIDYALKSSTVDPELLLDRFVVEATR